MKNFGFLAVGLLVAYLLTNIFPGIMFNKPEEKIKTVFRDSLVLVDTCFLKETVKIDTTIRKSKTIVQENVKPTDVIVTDSSITLPHPSLRSVKSSFYEYKDSNLIIKEVVVHSGEIYKFDRFISLDTPYITKTITKEVVIGTNEDVISTPETKYVYEKYNRIHLTGFAQYYGNNASMFDAGAGLRYSTKSNMDFGLDIGLTNLDRPMVRFNLGIPLIKFNKERYEK